MVEKQVKMSQSSERVSITTILDLNDHCLREIFKHLNVYDLRAVADVCSRFKQNAEPVFSLQFKDSCFDEGNNPNSDSYFRQLAPVLRNFGMLLNSLHISFIRGSELCQQSPHVAELITKYCGGSLNELKLSLFVLSVDVVQKMQPLLSRLRVLEMFMCTFEPTLLASQMFSSCFELHTLSLSRSEMFCADVTFPKLKSLNLYFNLSETNKDIERFLVSNP